MEFLRITADFLHGLRQADLAEQRVTAADLSRMRRARVETRNVADVQTDVLIVGASNGRSRQGRRAVDGSREGRYDAERVHASDRRCVAGGGRSGRIGIVHTCSQNRRGCGANSLILLGKMAPQAGLEPATLRLRANLFEPTGTSLWQLEVDSTCEVFNWRQPPPDRIHATLSPICPRVGVPSKFTAPWAHYSDPPLGRAAILESCARLSDDLG